jgi:hypothetical protein
VYVAIAPHQVERAGSVIRRCQGAGIRVGLWPLLADRDGRWASAWNGEPFAAYCRELLALLERDGARPDEVIIDLEPPIDITRRALRGRFGAAVSRPRHGLSALVTLVDELRSLFPVACAVAPWAASGGGRRGWQAIMGTPIDSLGFDRVFLMTYTSLVEGYSRGLLSRSHAEALLAHWSRHARAQFGDRSAIAVGVVGVGALGDEATYRDPDELVRDVGICASAGIGHVALFNLRGVLARGPGPWLEALSSATAIVAPSPSKRVRTLIAAIGGAGRIARLVSRRDQRG